MEKEHNFLAKIFKHLGAYFLIVLNFLVFKVEDDLDGCFMATRRSLRRGQNL